MFFSFCCFSGLLFLFLAQRWSKLCSVWTRHEAIFLREPYDQSPSGVWRLSTKIRLMAALFFSLALRKRDICKQITTKTGIFVLLILYYFCPFILVEHLLFYVSNLYDYYVDIGNCGWTPSTLMRTWMFRHYTHIFAVIPFSVWFASVLLVSSKNGKTLISGHHYIASIISPIESLIPLNSTPISYSPSPGTTWTFSSC